MTSFEKERARTFLRHLALASKKFQTKAPAQKIKKVAYVPSEHEKTRIKSLERKLNELNKMEKSFALLKQRLSEYTSLKKEEDLALDEIKTVKIKKLKAPKTISKPAGLKQLELKLKTLEQKYNLLRKKGYSEKDLKKVKDLIDKLKLKCRKFSTTL